MKRSSIGWLNSKLLPICWAATPSIRSISSSFSRPGSGQSLRSFSTMTLSEMLGGIGSTAASAVPVRENMVSTSGWALMARSNAICIAKDCSKDADGTRNACMAMSPSSSVGMNSRPSAMKEVSPTARAATAEISTIFGRDTAAWIAGSRNRRAKRRSQVSCSST